MSVPPFTPLTREDLARILSVSLSKLDQMIEADILPRPRTLGGRRQYWHPDVFYAHLDQLLRADDAPVPGSTDSRETIGPQDKSDAEVATKSGPSTEMRSVRSARTRDMARLSELNK
jgi:hypothetical protein